MKKYRKELKRWRKKQRRIRERLQRARYVVRDDGDTAIRGGNINYEIAEKAQGIAHGGIGAFEVLVNRLKLKVSIDTRLKLLKVHRPYSESDHVLNIAYNVLCGGQRLEDIELRRNDEAFLDAIGADSLPDPTTAGDFCRRFEEVDIRLLMEAIDESRLLAWQSQGEDFFQQAELHMDGSIVGTTGECKEGMDISYKGIWGYHPLIVTLDNTQEVLRIVNRPGNRPSHDDAWYEVDESIILCRKAGFRHIRLTGDTDFSQTAHLDRWHREGDITFVFGMDSRNNLCDIAEDLPEGNYERLQRRPRYTVKTTPRKRPERVKEQRIIDREYENIRLTAEDVADTKYRPTNCREEYRLIILRKDLSIEKGQQKLCDKYRYFFYLTNDWDSSADEIVFASNKRCDQENIIAQLKSLRSLHAPLNTLNANWAWMVIASLAWNLKCWFGLLLPPGEGRHKAEHDEQNRRVQRMEFRTFVLSFMAIPAQIVKTGRRIVYRLLSWSEWQPVLFRWLSATRQ